MTPSPQQKQSPAIPGWFRPSTPERVLKTWDHPKFDLSTDSLLVFAPDDALIGYAHIRSIRGHRPMTSRQQ